MEKIDKNELEDFVEIGFIHHPHGIKGEVFLRTHTENAEWVDLEEFAELYLGESKTNLQKYSLRGKRRHKKGVLLFLEGVESRNQSEELKKLTAFLPASFFSVSEEGEEFYLMELKGFTVISLSGDEIGIVTGFSENKAQDLLVVLDDKEKEHLIPYAEPVIQSVDFENKVLRVDLPEGWLEI